MTSETNVEPTDAGFESNESDSNQFNSNEFEKTVGKKERRKIIARNEGKESPWFGLGMFGLVGWSVVLPMLLGVMVGSWIDRQWPSQVSWTLTLMFVGLFVGCSNAWYWIQKESNDHE